MLPASAPARGPRARWRRRGRTWPAPHVPEAGPAPTTTPRRPAGTSAARHVDVVPRPPRAAEPASASAHPVRPGSRCPGSRRRCAGRTAPARPSSSQTSSGSASGGSSGEFEPVRVRSLAGVSCSSGSADQARRRATTRDGPVLAPSRPRQAGRPAGCSVGPAVDAGARAASADADLLGRDRADRPSRRRLTGPTGLTCRSSPSRARLPAPRHAPEGGRGTGRRRAPARRPCRSGR